MLMRFSIKLKGLFDPLGIRIRSGKLIKAAEKQERHAQLQKE